MQPTIQLNSSGNRDADARDLASGPLEQGGITVNDNNDVMRGLLTHQGHRCIKIIPAIERVRTNYDGYTQLYWSTSLLLQYIIQRWSSPVNNKLLHVENRFSHRVCDRKYQSPPDRRNYCRYDSRDRQHE